jgi:hypothetical protein
VRFRAPLIMVYTQTEDLLRELENTRNKMGRQFIQISLTQANEFEILREILQLFSKPMFSSNH